VLRKNDFSPEQLIALVRDHHKAGLTQAEVEAIDLAHKVVSHAHQVTQEDIEGLRRVGYEEAEILDIVLTAAARSFFAKVMDALAVEPDEVFIELEDELRQALTVGRPFPSPDPQGE
jgi:alkylhydroperoxidase family enzyme